MGSSFTSDPEAFSGEVWPFFTALAIVLGLAGFLLYADNHQLARQEGRFKECLHSFTTEVSDRERVVSCQKYRRFNFKTDSFLDGQAYHSDKLITEIMKEYAQ